MTNRGRPQRLHRNHETPSSRPLDPPIGNSAGVGDEEVAKTEAGAGEAAKTEATTVHQLCPLNEQVAATQPVGTAADDVGRPGLGDSRSSPAASNSQVTNLLSVDVEDYFHATGLSTHTSQSQWQDLPGRVEYTTRRLLHLFDERQVTATFFILGWIAARYPQLVREIHVAGHEIASHGWRHELVYEQTPETFRDDVERTKQFLEDLTSSAVYGYRAPSFSIVPSSSWALEVLAEVGYRYDASIFPVRRARYGDPNSPRGIHWVLSPSWEHDGLVEVPPATVVLMGRNIPVAGGGYLRAAPLAFTHWAIHRINRRDGRPAVVYIHPWEIDPDQPRLPATPGNRFRHYLNLHRTEDRLCNLLTEFDFAPILPSLSEALGAAFSAPDNLLRRWTRP